MSRPLARRSLATLACTHLLLVAFTAQAMSPVPPPTVWPEPRPQPLPQPSRPQQPTGNHALPPMLTAPDFQAPSAQNCRRPIQTREIPGREPGWRQESEASARSDRSRGYATRERLESAPPPAAPITTARPPSMESKRSAVVEDSASPAAGSVAEAPAPQMLPRRPAPVTAGMVDDNADFTAYMDFRGRTQVEHRARDISERYQLLVKDRAGRPVADAEVAVRSSQGAAMWARTDTAGRVWVHPNAFDSSRSSVYEVSVRQGGQEARGFLRRGQKSAVDITLSSTPLPARAQLDLVFLIDATGSMGDEIGKLKTSLAGIANEVAHLPSQPDLCFGMVAYRDKGDAFLLRSHDFTNDLNAFQRVLNNLRADGGGDTPEAMNEALHETVHNLSWRGDGTTRLVVLLADAPPHLDYGGPQYDNDMLAALGKGIKVFSVGASGLDRQGEYIQRQIAQYTGGRFVFLTYADASRPGSGSGRETSHDVSGYSVDTLDRLIVKLVRDELARLPSS
ncbi:VWA domain-containing protein [Ottowia thiooxydans]|uniref:Mg-chelatase subunit ChlD n=1 Tax=Ottowia thiooxydans TaxID=219182 RepID=A0ABV2QCB0_9BURK